MAEPVSVASFVISVDGFPLSPLEAARVQSIQVVEDLEALSTFTLQLSCWDVQRGAYVSNEAGSFSLGSLVNIKLGFDGSLASVFEGDITEHSLQLTGGGSPTLTIHGFNPLHRLDRGTRSRRWESVSESALLAEILQPYRLTGRATDLSTPDENVAQSHQSDLSFLRMRAASLGYELQYREGTVYFGPRNPSAGTGPAVISLMADRNLVDFNARLNLRGQVDQAMALYLDEDGETQRLITDYDGPADSGPMLAKKSFGSAVMRASVGTESNQGEASRVSEAALKKVADAYFSAGGSSRGDHRIRAGSVVEILNVPNRFAGKYLVTRATHSLSSGQIYRTSFSLRSWS